MKKLSLVLLSVFSMLFAQTHIVPEGFSGFTASFNHDQNVDFFGEGKFARDSYGNGIGFGYVYNGTFGIDFAYGYSLYDRKDVYDFNVQEGESTSEDQNFNFVENFRTENSNLGDKTFSFGLTYYLNESQNLFERSLPINLSLGFRYGTKNYSSDALNFLNQDFYGKFYSFEFGAFKEIETNANFKITYGLLFSKKVKNLGLIFFAEAFNLPTTTSIPDFLKSSIPPIASSLGSGDAIITFLKKLDSIIAFEHGGFFPK